MPSSDREGTKSDKCEGRRSQRGCCAPLGRPGKLLCPRRTAQGRRVVHESAPRSVSRGTLPFYTAGLLVENARVARNADARGRGTPSPSPEAAGTARRMQHSSLVKLRASHEDRAQTFQSPGLTFTASRIRSPCSWRGWHGCGGNRPGPRPDAPIERRCGLADLVSWTTQNVNQVT